MLFAVDYPFGRVRPDLRKARRGNRVTSSHYAAGETAKRRNGETAKRRNGEAREAVASRAFVEQLSDRAAGRA